MNIKHCHTRAGAAIRWNEWRFRSALGLWMITAIVAASGGAFAEPLPAGPAGVVELETPIRAVADQELRTGISLHLGRRAYDALRPHARVRLKSFPLEQGKTADLDLEQFSVTSPNTKLVLGTDDGDRPMPHPDVLLFRGHVVNEPNSLVFLGISRTQSNGYISLPGREYILAPRRLRGQDVDAADHVLYERFAAGANAPPSQFECQTRTAREPAPSFAPAPIDAQAAYVWRVGFVAIECDYEYGQAFDSVGDAFIYVIELLGAISSIYPRPSPTAIS